MYYFVKTNFTRLALAMAVATILIGCEGKDGLQGLQGPQGPAGPGGHDWPGPPPSGYLAADSIAGGTAYLKWYLEAAGGTGNLTNYGVTVAADFVRCKACHAWDGMGNAGSYADRTGVSTGTATRPDVSSVNLRSSIVSTTYQELYDLIERPAGRPLNLTSSAHPDYSTVLTPAQIWNIVKFLREEFVNPNELYDLQISGPAMHYEWNGASWVLMKPVLTYSNIGKGGSAASGASVFANKCSVCHGANGKDNPPEGFTSLGKFLRAKPHEAWFKAKFGEPPIMPPALVTSTQDLKDLYKALVDTVGFPD